MRTSGIVAVYGLLARAVGYRWCPYLACASKIVAQGDIIQIAELKSPNTSPEDDVESEQGYKGPSELTRKHLA